VSEDSDEMPTQIRCTVEKVRPTNLAGSFPLLVTVSIHSFFFAKGGVRYNLSRKIKTVLGWGGGGTGTIGSCRWRGRCEKKKRDRGKEEKRKKKGRRGRAWSIQ
jgi:hypothetical protein